MWCKSRINSEHTQSSFIRILTGGWFKPKRREPFLLKLVDLDLTISFPDFLKIKINRKILVCFLLALCLLFMGSLFAFCQIKFYFCVSLFQFLVSHYYFEFYANITIPLFSFCLLCFLHEYRTSTIVQSDARVDREDRLSAGRFRVWILRRRFCAHV